MYYFCFIYLFKKYVLNFYIKRKYLLSIEEFIKSIFEQVNIVCDLIEKKNKELPPKWINNNNNNNNINDNDKDKDKEYDALYISKYGSYGLRISRCSDLLNLILHC